MATQSKQHARPQTTTRFDRRKYSQSPEMEIRIKNGVAVISGHTDNHETGMQTALALGSLASIEKVFNLVQVDG